MAAAEAFRDRGVDVKVVVFERSGDADIVFYFIQTLKKLRLCSSVEMTCALVNFERGSGVVKKRLGVWA